MFGPHLKLPATLVPVNCLTDYYLAPVYLRKPCVTLFATVASLTHRVPTSAILVSSCVGRRCPRVFLATVGPDNRKVGSYLKECCAGQTNESSVTGGIQCDNNSSLATSSGCICETEIQRRRKIGLANKGKVPWNKGRGHTEETRERIQQRTREALSDPKVRKKMSECPRIHSYQTKAKIKVSLRKLWGQRLKRKHAKEKILQLWAESIANAAKDGGIGQGKLEWDSYEKHKREMALQEQAWAVQKAKEKELAHIRAEFLATKRSERMNRLAKKKKEQQERGKAGKLRSKTKRNPREEKEELTVSQEATLKARLMKIHIKKSVISQIRSEHQRAWKNLDVQFAKVEPSQKQVTFADQIRLAKAKRLELASQGSPGSLSEKKFREVNNTRTTNSPLICCM